MKKSNAMDNCRKPAQSPEMRTVKRPRRQPEKPLEHRVEPHDRSSSPDSVVSNRSYGDMNVKAGEFLAPNAEFPSSLHRRLNRCERNHRAREFRMAKLRDFADEKAKALLEFTETSPAQRQQVIEKAKSFVSEDAQLGAVIACMTRLVKQRLAQVGSREGWDTAKLIQAELQYVTPPEDRASSVPQPFETAEGRVMCATHAEWMRGRIPGMVQEVAAMSHIACANKLSQLRSMQNLREPRRKRFLADTNRELGGLLAREKRLEKMLDDSYVRICELKVANHKEKRRIEKLELRIPKRIELSFVDFDAHTSIDEVALPAQEGKSSPQTQSDVEGGSSSFLSASDLHLMNWAAFPKKITIRPKPAKKRATRKKPKALPAKLEGSSSSEGRSSLKMRAPKRGLLAEGGEGESSPSAERKRRRSSPAEADDSSSPERSPSATQLPRNCPPAKTATQSGSPHTCRSRSPLDAVDVSTSSPLRVTFVRKRTNPEETDDSSSPKRSRRSDPRDDCPEPSTQ